MMLLGEISRADYSESVLPSEVEHPIRVWLDDEREAPAGWVRCRQPWEVVVLLETGGVVELSLDHDLGDDARGTGYDVLVWLEGKVAMSGGFEAPTIHVHTANPSARQRMLAAVRSILSLRTRVATPATHR